MQIGVIGISVTAARYFILSSVLLCPIPSLLFPILSYPTRSHPTIYYPVMLHLIIAYLSFPALSCPIRAFRIDYHTSNETVVVIIPAFSRIRNEHISIHLHPFRPILPQGNQSCLDFIVELARIIEQL